jgi:hypothetical protein
MGLELVLGAGYASCCEEVGVCAVAPLGPEGKLAGGVYCEPGGAAFLCGVACLPRPSVFVMSLNKLTPPCPKGNTALPAFPKALIYVPIPMPMPPCGPCPPRIWRMS